MPHNPLKARFHSGVSALRVQQLVSTSNTSKVRRAEARPSDTRNARNARPTPLQTIGDSVWMFQRSDPSMPQSPQGWALRMSSPRSFAGDGTQASTRATFGAEKFRHV